MPLPIWIADALRSDIIIIEQSWWRCVEAQHKISTLKLVDSLQEHEILEDILEESKPPVPPECQNLHYLYMTPFRYGNYPNGSRFRKAGISAGVYYVSETAKTAIIETAYNLSLFYKHSPYTPFPGNPIEHSAFNVPIKTASAIDLTKSSFNRAKKLWKNKKDYNACQELESMARKSGVELIIYQSVRNPDFAKNAALLTCSGFARNGPNKYQSWRMLFNKSGVHFICERPAQKFSLQF